MIDKKKKIAAMAMLGIMATIPLQTTSAASYGLNSGLHINFGHHVNHLSYGHSRGHNRRFANRYRNAHSGHTDTHRYRDYGHSNHGHNRYAGAATGYRGGHSCRETYKHQTDYNGNLIKIKGTLCYDSYGKPYIVPGSRYVDSTYH